MSTFALIHGAGDSGWSWHLVEAELRALGHQSVAPDLPVADSSTMSDYSDAVIDALGSVGTRGGIVVVGQSFGGFTATLVASRIPTDALVYVTAMVPTLGEAPQDWWSNTGYTDAVREQAERDGGLSGNDDPYVSFFHDVPRALADEAISRGRNHPSPASTVDPLPISVMPTVPTHFVLCSEDRFFPADFMRRVVAERLGVVPDEIAASHCVALSRPRQLAALLDSYSR